MITAEQLEQHDWFCGVGDRTKWFYDSWEYKFLIPTQELYYINDGMGEPELIAKVTSMEQLIEIYEALEGSKRGYERMKLKE